MNILRLACAVAFSSLIASAVSAASFDCAKASSYTEKAICADAKLGSLDEAMAAKYKYAVSLGKEVIRNEQREWLKTLKNCNSPDCIKNAYTQRLASLDEFIQMSERQNNLQANSKNTENKTTSISKNDYTNAKANLEKVDKALECAVVYDSLAKTYTDMSEKPNFSQVTGTSLEMIRSIIRDREKSKSHYASIYVKELKLATKNEEAVIDSMLQKYNTNIKILPRIPMAMASFWGY